MIISRTPFRVSFIGGGSDLKEYYSNNGYGAVISTAIEKYMYIAIHPYFQNKIRLKYSVTEDVGSVNDIKHPIIKECIRRVNIDRGIEIASFADIPSGTGLGSSSSFTVGLLNALYIHCGVIKTNEELAKEACEIEIDILKEPIGKQDQYATAIGGFNHIKFHQDEEVETLSLNISKSFIKKFASTLRLYYIGSNRSASSILTQQKQNMSKNNKVKIMKKMVRLTEDFKNALFNEDLKSAGALLNHNWELKKQMASNISNDKINVMYNEALKCGAMGGKLLGAGGTGFLLIMAHNHKLIEKKLNCRFLDVNLDSIGSKIIYNN